MYPNRRRTLKALIFTCALAACQTPPEAPPPASAAAVPAPIVTAGQSWEYAVRDGYTGLPRGLYRYTVARADPARYTVDVTRDGERIDAYVYANGWNGIELPLTNLQRFHFDPPFAAFEFPLIRAKAGVESRAQPILRPAAATRCTCTPP